MSLFVVDVESDGQAPGLYSMVCFGAILVTEDLSTTFYGETKPITDNYNEEALGVSGFSRADHLSFEDPEKVMIKFEEWIKKNSIGKPTFISDNPAFDWQFINYYFHKYLGRNPFGYSARRIGDLYCGMQKDAYAKWKHLRKTKADHNPVNDAKGNAEAIIEMQKRGLRINLY